MSVLLLPSNIKSLAPIASTETGRYALNGFHIIDNKDTYRIEVTNGRAMGIVEGKMQDESSFPVHLIPALKAAPNTAGHAIVPTKSVVDICKKVSAKAVRAKPSLGNIACVMSPRVVTLAATDLERPSVEQPAPIEGRYPNVSEVIPKDTPVATVTFDPAEMVNLLNAAAQFDDPDESGKVAVTLALHNHPSYPLIVLRSSSAKNSNRFLGVLVAYTMPAKDGKKNKIMPMTEEYLARLKEWNDVLSGAGITPKGEAFNGVIEAKPVSYKEEPEEQEEIEDSPPASAPPDTPEDEQPYDDSGDDGEDEPEPEPTEAETNAGRSQPDSVKSWSSTAGPRQTKKALDAIRSLRSHGQSWIDVTDHGDVKLTRIFGEVSKPVQEAMQALGDALSWQITADNHDKIIAACSAFIQQIPLERKDSRTTPEIRAERESKFKEATEKRQLEDAAKKTAVNVIVTQLKAQYPWAIQSGMSDHARAAANLKTLLNKTFPGVKFSVKSSSFSGGDSITVKYDLGPVVKDVEAIAYQFKEGSFNGMNDSYEYDSSHESKAWRTVMGGSKYIHVERDIPMAESLMVRKMIIDHLGVKDQGYNTYSPGGESVDTLVRQAFNINIPIGSKVVGVNRLPEGYRVVLEQSAVVAGGATPYHVEKHWHTKKAFDMWLVVLDADLEREDFTKARASAVLANGWYSHKWGKTPGGFAFKSEAEATQWAASYFK